MNLIYGAGSEVMHSISIRLYPNYLPGYEHTYVARTASDISLSIEDICTSLVKRGGYSGEYKDLINNVKQFLDEMAYQLLDGYKINTGYFTIHVNVGGVFKDQRDQPDPQHNPMSVRFFPLKPLRDMARAVRVVNQGLAETSGHIALFWDGDLKAENTIFASGNQFILTGDKIKIEGDDPEVGLFFAPTDGSPAVKVTRILENNPSKIIGIIPEVKHSFNRIEIRTQFSGATPLKWPRLITSRFTLEHI